MNNSTNGFDERRLADFKRIVEGYLLSIVCICGLLGNALTCIVLSSRFMRTSITNIYIFALSCASSFVLVGFLLTHGIRATFRAEVFYCLIFTRMFPIHVTCLLIQIYLTAAVAFDRFILICLPFCSRKWRSPKLAICVVFSICVFSMLYCIPFWFEFTLIKEYNRTNIRVSRFGSHRLFRLIMRKYLYFIFVFLLPLSIILICKILIIKNLYLIEKRKRLLGTSLKTNRSSNAMNFLLLSIVFLFLLTQIPYFVFNVLYSLSGATLMKNLLARQYLVINNLLSVINASATFILYAFFDRKFREVSEYFLFCRPLPAHFHSRNAAIRLLSENFTLSKRRSTMNSTYRWSTYINNNSIDSRKKNLIISHSMPANV
ncbi:unnamed protein product [Rotaria socialis]|uniref:G-protein coupled receptors family 1 profile domain-containing protein n=1 Tax=Rotaria socialis TaxID=392032 RepID=A0A818N377_9BILA|nr:unnamed protein product [Rotaria socialis]CAF4249169.1 unnamed protein product [Rotaria socialis]